MKVVDRRSVSKAYKTAEEHVVDLYQIGQSTFPEPGEYRESVLDIFDSCIAVVQEEADGEAMKNRYKGEEVRGAQRMAESIVKQLKALRGE